MEDITKTGPVGLKGLKGLNQQSDPNTEYFNSLMKSSGKKIREIYTPEVSQDIGLTLAGAGYGQSSYDDAITNLSQLDNIDDVRAEQQPLYAKWGAGLGKGIALAGTTFLDGTIGLTYGLASAVWNKDVSRLWDNNVSNALQAINEQLEVILPNYRSREEQERPWYGNLGTANFWADSFLKNIGFTVGAFYSGGAWTKALKAIGWMKGAMAAKSVGSMVSAVNEGRIEANQEVDNWKKLEYEKLADEYEELYNSIDSQPDTLIYNPETGAMESSKQMRLRELQDNLRAEQQSIDDRAKKMGLTILIGNTVLLSLDHLSTFGKLYARGFKNSRTISNGMKSSFREGLKKAGVELAEEEAGIGIRKEAGKYVFNKISNKKAIGRGLKTGLVEGNEELAQAFISDYAGNRQTYDSPDSYYLALKDREAELKTKDFMTSAVEGFTNTYGNGDRYEEFAVGALTGLLGIPTFGRVNNSDHNTYLGRGKIVGLSGGLFGEISNAKYQNAQGEGAVQGMNKFIDKLKTQKGYFVQSQSFTDAMDGWADEGNTFEFKNAENNDDFATISRFAKAGRLSDLRELINQDFESISEEQLTDIANNTTSKFGGWRATDGTLMSDTQEGRDLMRNELSLKRDKILSEIDRYEKSVEAVRAIGNNSLTDDQVNELAWLNWKIGKFDERFSSIKRENEPLLRVLREGIEEFRRSIDESSEEGKKWLSSINTFSQFLSYLSNSSSSLDMASRMAANPKLMETISNKDFFDIFADRSGLNFEDYSNVMNNLIDAARLATASKTFNDRYKEFKEDPIKLIKNRQNIDKKKERVNEATNNVQDIDKVRSKSVSDLSASMRDGTFDVKAFDSLIEELEGEDIEEQKNKVKEAQAINKSSEQLSQSIDSAELEGIDPLEMEMVKRDAQSLLQKATESAESVDDLYNTNTEAWLDPRNLPVMEDESLDLEEAQKRLDAARSLVQQQLAQVKDAAEVMSQIPNPSQPQAAPERGTTGHDSVNKTVTENERRQREAEASAKESAKVDRVTAYNKGIDVITSTMPDSVKDFYKKSATQLLTDLNLLLNKGLSDEEIVSVLSVNNTYKNLNGADPRINNLLNDYINSYRKESTETKLTEATPTANPRIVTPVIALSTITDVQPPEVDMGSSKVGGVYMFLRPSTTEFPIHLERGVFTPYYKLVKGTGRYTEAEERRMEAVYNYLLNNGAFLRVNEGRVKAGDTVGFMIDPVLNEEAGDTVILIVNKEGKVIGDLPAKSSKTFKDYAGLAELVDKIEKEYNDTGKITETTKVDKNMPGKVPYINEYNTLNAIANGNGFVLGIALESGSTPSIMIEGGRTKRSRGDRDDLAMRPANAVAGQPFLMLETSSSTRHYWPVPIIMKPFSEVTQSTQLHKAVGNVISRILQKSSRPAEVKDNLLDVLALEDAYVEYNGDEVKLRVKKTGTGWEEIFKGVPTPETLTQVMQKLYGTPYQVSRKFINGEYNGQSYNDMIGEIAETNLPIGTMHTVNDWFTMKSANGQKTVSPRTRGENPHRAESNFVRVNYKGSTTLTVDTKSWEVSDSTGKVYSGEKADLVKAYAWGIHTNQDMTKPYLTKWGKYDPVKGEFVKSVPTTTPIDESLLEGLDSAIQGLEEVKASRENASQSSTSTSPLADEGNTSTSTEKVQIVEATTTQGANPETEELSSEEAKQKVASAGLLNGTMRALIWSNISLEAQRLIASKAGRPKAVQWMDALSKAYDPMTNTFDLNKLAGKPKSVEEYLNSKPKFERVEKVEGTDKTWNKEKEIKWLSNVLPQLNSKDRLRIHDGLIKISKKDRGGEAYGQFLNGIITIASNAARGTLYHEAFHAVVDTLLNNQELGLLFQAAEEKWGNIGMIELEERMAEDFRKYVQLEETPILGKVVRIYRTLKHLVQSLFRKEPYINKIYYNINRGEYANRELNDIKSVTPNIDESSDRSNDVRYSRVPDIQDLQNIVDSNINNAVLWKSFSRSRIKRMIAWKKLKQEMQNKWGITINGRQDRNYIWHITSITTNTNYENITSNNIEQYHRDKIVYGNLKEADRNYLEERGITKEDYNNMSQKEKEVLFHCR